MVDWRTVGGGKAWSATASQPMTIRQYQAAHNYARPPAEFKVSKWGKISIRTGSRILRLRKSVTRLNEKYSSFTGSAKKDAAAEKANKLTFTRRNIALRDVEHDFDKSVNRLVEDLANGKIKTTKGVIKALNALGVQAERLRSRFDNQKGGEEFAGRAIVNLQESLEALRLADRSPNKAKYKQAKALLKQTATELKGNTSKLMGSSFKQGKDLHLFNLKLANDLSEAVDPKPKSSAKSAIKSANAVQVRSFGVADDQYANEKLGWRGEKMFDAPDLDGLKQTDADFDWGNEGHVSKLETKDGKRKLCGKFERSAAEAHLDHELDAYKAIYKANGGKPHPNLGKVYGMAMVKFATKTERGLIMDEVQGQKGTIAMKHLREAYENGEISHKEYWGSVQFIARRLLAVNELINKAGITHNDIKPENFVIDKHTGEPVLLDLGLSSKLGDKSGGATDEFLAPEVYDDKHAASEKSDVFSIAASLLESTESIPRGINRDVKPYQGLAISKTGHATDKYGKVHRAPGIAGASTLYTQFMDRLLDPNPKNRPTSAEAAKLGFLADKPISDEEAKAVISGVMKRTSSTAEKLTGVAFERDKRRRTFKTLNAEAIKHSQIALTKAPKTYLAHDRFSPGNCYDQLCIADDLLSKAANSGTHASSISGLKNSMLHLLDRMHQRAVNGDAKELSAGDRDVIRTESTVVADDAKEFLRTKPPYRPVHADRDRIQVLHARAKAQVALETLAGADDDASQLKSMVETERKLSALLDGMDQAREAAQPTRVALESALDAWKDEADAALSKFDANKPRHKSGVRQTGSGQYIHSPQSELDAAKHSKSVAIHAQKAKEETAHLRESMEKFADQAQAFLAGPGLAGLSAKEREKLRDGLTTARRLLNLDREWIKSAENIDMKHLEALAKGGKPVWFDDKSPDQPPAQQPVASAPRDIGAVADMTKREIASRMNTIAQFAGKVGGVNYRALSLLVDKVQDQDKPDPDDMLQIAALSYGLRRDVRAGVDDSYGDPYALKLCDTFEQIGVIAGGYIAAARTAGADNADAPDPSSQPAPHPSSQSAPHPQSAEQQNIGRNDPAAGPRVPPPADLNEAMQRVDDIAEKLDFPVGSMRGLMIKVLSGNGDLADLQKLDRKAGELQRQATMGWHKTRNPEYRNLHNALRSARLLAQNQAAALTPPDATGPRTPPPTNLDEAFTRTEALAQELDMPIGVLTKQYQKVQKEGPNPVNLKPLHDMAKNLRQRADQQHNETGRAEFADLAKLAGAVQFFAQPVEPKLMV